MLTPSNDSPFVTINQSDLNNVEVLNEKLRQGCQKGFYFIEATEECKQLLSKAVEFGNNFFNDSAYNTLNLDQVSGFRQRDNYQIESLILEEKYWVKHLPENVKDLANKMTKVGLDLLGKTLQHLEIPREEWEQATGGAVAEESRAGNFLSFHHYRPEKKECEGLFAHRDFGLLTILYVTKPGLEVYVDGALHPVLPLKDYFLINYGEALEMYVGNASKITAAWHRVLKIIESRVSFGIFINHSESAPVYKRVNGEIIQEEKTHLDYVIKKFSSYDVPPDIMKVQIEQELQEVHSKT